MEMTTMLNKTALPVEFSMDGYPGRPPTVYKAKGGGTVDVPTKYINSGVVAQLCPALVVAPEDPEALEAAQKATKKAAAEAKKVAAKAAKEADKEKAAAKKAAGAKG